VERLAALLAHFLRRHARRAQGLPGRPRAAPTLGRVFKVLPSSGGLRAPPAALLVG
jgi:hypothetical protein